MSTELLTTAVDCFWLFFGGVLVFFMQTGFTMVEAGFTRSKNTGNIIMKNIVDFMFGSIIYWFIGYGLMYGEGNGFIGIPFGDMFMNGMAGAENMDYTALFFQTVFCATSATIVSGAMAERTNFKAYCIYSAAISLFIYPIAGHWVWGGGWLSQLDLPFHDFAGSAVIHMVGGLSALIGATILGPRIGKFERDKDGKVTKVNAIPGHSLTIGALGVFILWFGWYGFNGAAATSIDQLASIFVTTTIAPALATVTCMIFTWLKYGKPDVSMCLNASLAGLVAITAGCDVVSGLGAIIIGIVSGFLVCFGVWLLDHKLHVDDPVGAVAVHMFNGLWGGLAVGLFATTSAPDNSDYTGLFYGGGFKLFGVQLLGCVCILAWTAIMITITFLILKHTIGLRVSAEEEITGLDATEHNLPSAYADFMPSVHSIAFTNMEAEKVGVEPIQAEYIQKPTDGSAAKITKVAVVCNPDKLDALKAALASIGVNGLTVTQVLGCGAQKGNTAYYRGVRMQGTKLLPKVKVEVILAKIPTSVVVDTIQKVLYSGKIGDGKIFVYDVEDVVKVRTGESGYDALQNDGDE